MDGARWSRAFLYVQAAEVKRAALIKRSVDIPRVPRQGADSAFWQHLESILPIDGDALDVGTGTGRVALNVAPRVRSVAGIDIDPSSLEAARWDAKRRGILNASFHEADAETADLTSPVGGRTYSLVTARLYLSRSLLPRLAGALAPGGHLVLEALEAANWAEAGGSRFNLPATEVVDALLAAGLDVVDARVESERHPLPDAKAGEALLKERRLWTKWRQDGRWQRLRASVRSGAGSLTDAHLVVWARRPSA